MFVTGILLQLEYVMFAVDLVLFLVLFALRRMKFHDLLFWLLFMLILPICAFIAYIFIGPPIYRGGLKAPAHSGEGLKYIEEELAAHPERSEELTFARALCQAGAYPYSNDNEVEYVGEGPAYFDRLLTDLRNARSSISIECYIIRRDGLSRQFMDILIERAKAGVQVRIMFDAYGFGLRQSDAVIELKRAGGQYAMFHSMFLLALSPRKNNRDHRKLAVIDGEVGYIGGFNVGDEYIDKSPRFGHWRDGAVRFQGSQVKELQTLFAEDWQIAAHEDLMARPELFPPPAARGSVPMQIVGGGPVNPGSNPLHLQYLTLIDDSEERVYIETPYLAPPETLFYALCVRAMSGTDVRIIIPDRPDHPCVFWANRYYADRLIAHGVRVFVYHGGFLHSKLLVGDSYYCSVGSGNLDERSMNLNFECNAMLYSAALGRQLEDCFLHDLTCCTEYTREDYANRTLWQKTLTAFSMAFYDQL